MLFDHVALCVIQLKVAVGIAQSRSGVPKPVQPVRGVGRVPIVEEIIVQQSAAHKSALVHFEVQPQPYHVFGKRIQRAGRLAAAGSEPFDAGERRLRPHLRRRRAVSAALCGAAQMQKERVMLRAAGGIPYELTRGRVKRLNLYIKIDRGKSYGIDLYRRR